jgi:hypothetical protein
MTNLAFREHERLLREATQHLVEDYTANARVSAGRVLAAVVRAKRRVLDGRRVLNLDAPPADEYISLVIGLAHQELDNVQGSADRHGRVPS